jgi:cytochrome c oxidase assembly protein subunit 15
LSTDPWLHRFALFVAWSTLVLIFAGGLVTSTESGLAVPDWPLSYGMLFPPMVGGILFEHGHRMVAASVGILTIVLAVWLARREARPWVRRLGWAALGAVVCQGILGGITVLYLLPSAVSVSHAALAEIFFSLTVTIAVVTSRRWQRAEPRLDDTCSPRLGLLAPAVTLLVYGQIVLGAVMRHTSSGLAIPDFPLAFGRLVPPLASRQVAIHFAHRLGAAVVVLAVGWLATRIAVRHRSEPALARGAAVLGALVAAQLGLGALTIWSSRAVVPATLHVAGGAATLAASLYVTLHARRLARPHPRLAHAATAQPARAQSGS